MHLFSFWRAVTIWWSSTTPMSARSPPRTASRRSPTLPTISLKTLLGYTFEGRQWAILPRRWRHGDSAAPTGSTRRRAIGTKWPGSRRAVRWCCRWRHRVGLLGVLHSRGQSGGAVRDDGRRLHPRLATTASPPLNELRRVVDLLDPANFAMDPISPPRRRWPGLIPKSRSCRSAMAMSFCRAGFQRQPAGLPMSRCRTTAARHSATQLCSFGATGAARRCLNMAWLASAEVQRGLYARAGGQPGNAAAWDDTGVTADAHGFYRATRKTLERAYVRPRHRGYMAFQVAAAERLNSGLVARACSRHQCRSQCYVRGSF